MKKVSVRAVASGYPMQLLAAVARQPVTIAIGVSGSREIQHYSGGIFSGYCPTRTDHAVVVVGYGVHNNRAYWLVKNSWGGHWGHAGYLYMARGREYGEGLCGLQLYPSYPIKRSANPASKAAASGEIRNSGVTLHLYVPWGVFVGRCE